MFVVWLDRKFEAVRLVARKAVLWLQCVPNGTFGLLMQVSAR